LAQQEKSGINQTVIQHYMEVLHILY